MTILVLLIGSNIIVIPEYYFLLHARASSELVPARNAVFNCDSRILYDVITFYASVMTY